MAESTVPENSAAGMAPATPPLAVAARIDRLDGLLQSLGERRPSLDALPEIVGSQGDNQLAQVRLGIAGSLFTAQRFRYPATAAHALRVALGCSAWALHGRLSPHDRDVIEVAALLHDVGVIALPDQTLLKPGPLDPKEVRLFEQSRRIGVEILRSACAEPAILQIVENVPAWYDGSRSGYPVSGSQIPLGARMIAVVEAYDSMTTDHVFRRAMPHERAMGELYQGAGTQFDPDLVQGFAQIAACDLVGLRGAVARQWLQTLDPEAASGFWAAGGAPAPTGPANDSGLFENRLLDQMHDAVLFVDADLRILRWNHGAERLTGIDASGICGRVWSPSLLGMENEKGGRVNDEDCPVQSTLRTGVQSLRRLTIWDRAGRLVPVDSQAIPVTTADGHIHGVVLMLHDASSKISLEERCQSLHEKATRDPLTQVANRAEFDRVHELFVQTHRDRRVPCALIMCDIDHFKQVNDVFGHPAGDEVIKALAAILRSSCRSGDLVARYGGEEFVMLCANCDNTSAARRADQVRRALAQQPQPMLGGRSVSASFGVTEIQSGDTPETMLRRADRALLTAKETGRNRVVQLGVGSEPAGPADAPDPAPDDAGPMALVVRQVLITPVPVAVAVEKLRGFVADHQARIVAIDGDRLELDIDDGAARMRRASDRPVAFRLEVRLKEEQLARADRAAAEGCGVSQTRMHVSIAPRRNRDRRRADAAQRAREVLASFRSYLMATQEEEIAEAQPPEGMFRRIGRAFLGR